jgi:hypothetical protein
MNCNKCGATIDESLKFCGMCGNALKQNPNATIHNASSFQRVMRMSPKRFGLVWVALLVCGVLFFMWHKNNETWQVVGSNGKMTGYADLSTIHSSNGIVEMTMLIEYEEKQTSGAQSFKELVEFACEEGKLRTVHIDFFSENEAGGKLLSAKDITMDWESVTPGSNNEKALKLACGKR